MKDTININKVKGWLMVTTIDKDGNRQLVVDRKNALTADAPEILLQNLAGVASWAIQNIKAYKAAVLLGTTPDVTVSFPTVRSVQFTATFTEASFNDTLDEVRLMSESTDAFSSVTGLSILKDNTLKLEVVWKISIP